MDWEEKLAKELPKVELHLHLDGSISPGNIMFDQIFIDFILHFILMSQN